MAYNEIIDLLAEYQERTGLSLEDSPLYHAEIEPSEVLRGIWKAYDHAAGLVPSEQRKPLLKYAHLACACLFLAEAVTQSEEQQKIANFHATAEFKLAIQNS